MVTTKELIEGANSIAKLETGIFRTTDVRWYSDPRPHTVGNISFSQANTSPPRLLLGLNALDMRIPRVRCNLLSLTAHNAEIDIESWEDTKLYSAGCSWLSIPREDLDLQCGRFDTLEDHSMTKPQKLTTRRITFERPYYALPKVVVWLEALSTPEHNCRIRVKAEHVDISGFTLHVESWADTDILCATAAWFAHSANREDIRSGTFHTRDVRSWAQPRLQTSSYIPFGGRRFSKKPRVFSALNTLDVDKGRNLRIRLHTSDLTMNGMTWHLDGWSDTTVYSAGASYIAFDQE